MSKRAKETLGVVFGIAMWTGLFMIFLVKSGIYVF